MQNGLQRMFCLVCHSKVSHHVASFSWLVLKLAHFVVVVVGGVMNARSVNGLVKLIEKLMNGELGRLPRTSPAARSCDFCVSGRVSCYEPMTDFL